MNNKHEKTDGNHEKTNKIVIAILIVLTACNLRAPITGVGAIINIISEDLSLSPAMAGSVTTLPLLAFAAISPAVVFLSRKLGAGKVLLTSLIMLNLGIVLRSFFENIGLFVGTVVAGLGIGIGNVLLPAIIKTYFPHKIESMTSLYTVVMQVTSAGFVAISVPTAENLGWQWALAILLPMTLLAMFFSIPNRNAQISSENTQQKTGAIYKSPVSWWISFYMGAQSMIFYCFIAWLSPILQDKGYSQINAGFVLSAYVVMGFVGSAAIPFIMKRNKTQVATGVELSLLYIAALLVMMLGKSSLVLIPAVLICGFCSGTFVSFVMALFGLRTSNGEDASTLSGLAQSIGYLIAAIGPVLLGKVHSISGGWQIPLFILVLTAVFLLAVSKTVGKDRII